MVFCCCSPSASGSTCCAFRDCILHTLVVTSGYLSYCCLSIISNQSAHSPMTSDINKAFSSTTAAHWIFSLFRSILCKPKRWSCMKIPVEQLFLKYADQSVWHQQPFHVQSHLNPLNSDARFEFQQVIFTTSRCLNAMSCCHMIS